MRKSIITLTLAHIGETCTAMKMTLAVFAIITVNLLQGCVWIARLEYSVPDQQVNEWVASSQNEFVFNGTRLFVFPANLKFKGLEGPIIPFMPFWGGYDKKPFGVFIRISPGEEAGSLYFDGRRVHLVMDSSTMLAPSQIKGPAPYSVEGCKQLRDEAGKPADQEIFVFEAVCLGLLFDHEPPPPGQTFSLIIEGLTVSRETLVPLRLSFKETKSQWNVGVGDSAVLDLTR